jgi:hypothetical protein
VFDFIEENIKQKAGVLTPALVRKKFLFIIRLVYFRRINFFVSINFPEVRV